MSKLGVYINVHALIMYADLRWSLLVLQVTVKHIAFYRKIFYNYKQKWKCIPKSFNVIYMHNVHNASFVNMYSYIFQSSDLL